MIDNEIINALGLSVSFMGVMLSIVSIGIIFFISRTSKKSKKELIKISFLIISWSTFIILNTFFNVGTENNALVFLKYSFVHVSIILFGVIIVLASLLMLSHLSKKFEEGLLIIALTAAIVSIFEKIIFPFFWNPLIGLINQIIMIIPILLGFFMIILNVINDKN
ncbi:MAG: hypothetical protein IH845_00430 [Nanoarchaeota archaeon]|nr:hypothetical protein [Nanoarchaeota archaeon]